ncbi:winged helix-turn-helix domain-containing protein [Vibrio sp. MA40-2]|uniref:winged helix-turn-helix domain-containing protein n=1 Tax=Vibrio sp. MA40-2 TaxID=3391828 RepID=UPI0039A50305
MMNRCLFDNCQECVKYDVNNMAYKPVKLRQNCGASNKHQRLLCILSSKGDGAVFSTEEIKAFVWPLSVVGESSVPQLVHHAKKFLPDGYDIVCIRKRGYLLITPNDKAFKIRGLNNEL